MARRVLKEAKKLLTEVRALYSKKKWMKSTSKVSLSPDFFTRAVEPPPTRHQLAIEFVSFLFYERLCTGNRASQLVQIRLWVVSLL